MQDDVVRDDVVGRADGEGDADAAVGRITPAQLREWRKIMVWSDGEGLDPAAVSDLLDEVELLQRELASVRRSLRFRGHRDPH